MKTLTVINKIGEYTIGSKMSPMLRQQTETEVRELNELEPEIHRRDLSDLQNISDSQLFLLWLRS